MNRKPTEATALLHAFAVVLALFAVGALADLAWHWCLERMS